MNVQITWKGTDITTSVIEYSREQDICTGFGTVDLTVEAKTARNFLPWDKVIIYEESDKIAEYNVASAEQTIPGGTYGVSCQDDSKRLTDYFIDEQYTITYPSTARYWIELFLNAAGVSYNFNTVGYGADLSENTTLGITSAYDAILNLLQMSGWYFYFDKDNICQIGKLNVQPDIVTETFYGDTITEIGYVKSDKMLRNRVIVWGAGDSDTGQWIYADTSKTTGWERSDSDYRTVVYANPYIRTFGIAYYLAATILAEFSKTVPEKNLVVIGSYSDVILGSFIRGDTSLMMVDGIVTHITVNMSSNGLISTYTLDKRCPRLFGYADWNDYVYIGTEGSGVWRKLLLSSTWNNYSTGITNLNIKDVVAYNGMLGSVSYPNGELYIRHTSEGSWSPYTPAGLIDAFAPSGESIITSGIIAEACSINRLEGINGLITAGFTRVNPNYHPSSGYVPPSGIGQSRFITPNATFPPSGNRSWIEGVWLGGVPQYSQQVIVISGDRPIYDFGIVDLETNWDGINLISAYEGRAPVITGTGIYDTETDYGHSSEGDYWGTYSADTIRGYSSSLKVFMPPPTSGISSDVGVVEANHEYYPNPHGYSIGSAEIYSNEMSNFYIDDDDKTDGTIYSFWNSYNPGVSEDNTTIFKVVCNTNVASGIMESQQYEYHHSAIWHDTEDYTGISENYFYKTGDDTFSATRIERVAIDSDWTIRFSTTFMKITDGVIPASGVLEVTGTAVNSIHNYVAVENQHFTIQPLGFDPYNEYVSHSTGRYIAIQYCKLVDYIPPTPAPPLDGWNVYDYYIATCDMLTGTVTETVIDRITHPLPLYGNEGGTIVIGPRYTGISPNWMYFAIIDTDSFYPRSKNDNLEWKWRIYPIRVNKNTGAIQINYIEKLWHDVPGLRVNYIELIDTWDMMWTQGYWPDSRLLPMFFWPCNENPDTGEGFGHLLAYTNIRLVSMHEHDPGEDRFILVNVLDLEIGDLIVSSNYNYMLYEEAFPPPDSTGGNVDCNPWVIEPTHMYDPDHFIVYPFFPTFSRNLTNTPVIHRFLNTFGGGTTNWVFVNPHNFDDFIDIEYPTLKPSKDNGIWNDVGYISEAMDDYDDSIYLNYDGNGSLICGLDVNGKIRKYVFPVMEWTMSGGVPTGYGYYGEFGGVVLQNKIYTGDAVYFFATLASNVIGGGRYDIIRHDPTIPPSGSFTIIYTSAVPFKIDAAKNVPTVIYTEPAYDDYSSSHLGRSFLNEARDFRVIYPYNPVWDVRTFDYTDTAGFFPASGIIGQFLDRYVGVAGGGQGALMFNTELAVGSGLFSVLYQPSGGIVTHLDFTNNDPDPYIFIGTGSGVAGSGIAASGRFYQRDTESYFFTDYSAGLPSSKITVIRADDRM